MEKVKIFSRIYKDSYGKIGFTIGQNNTPVYDNKMYYKDLFFFINFCVNFKDTWYMLSTAPIKRIWKNRKYILEFNGKELDYDIILNLKSFIVDNLDRVKPSSKLEETENDFLMNKLIPRILHKEGYKKVFFNQEIVLLGQNEGLDRKRYPVSISINKNIHEFLIKEKSFVQDELIYLKDENLIESTEEPIVNYESKIYNDAVQTWLSGFDKYFIKNTKYEKPYEKNLKKIMIHFLESILEIK